MGTRGGGLSLVGRTLQTLSVAENKCLLQFLAENAPNLGPRVCTPKWRSYFYVGCDGLHFKGLGTRILPSK